MSGQYKNANFLKPREKIRIKGAESLSDRELLQVIIGSGTAKIGAAKLSKHVLKLTKTVDNVLFRDLIALPGIGEAQASRLAAVFELSRRSSSVNRFPVFDNEDSLVGLIPDDTHDLWLVTLDGGHRLIERRYLDGLAGMALIRTVCSYMVKDGAAKIIILKHVDTLTPQLADLSLARNLKLALQPFEVKVDMLLIHGKSHRSVIGAA